MKKLALALVCLVSVAFFASCDPEETIAPTVTPVTEEGYIHDGMVLELGESYPIGFVCHGTSQLANLTITVNDNVWVDTLISGNDFTFNGSISFEENESREIIGDAVIKATVKDVLNMTDNCVMTVNINKESALTVTDFSWNRHGAAAVTGGIEEFGLQWNSNAKDEIFAQIKPVDGAVLYIFEPEVWDATVTELDKATLFSEQQFGVAVFSGVSAWATHHDYDFVIGTTYNGQNHLLHITEGIVTTFKGTDIVINGQAK